MNFPDGVGMGVGDIHIGLGTWCVHLCVLNYVPNCVRTLKYALKYAHNYALKYVHKYFNTQICTKICPKFSKNMCAVGWQISRIWFCTLDHRCDQ